MTKIFDREKLEFISNNLVLAFDWSGTPEGNVFWEDVSAKLSRILTEVQVQICSECGRELPCQ